MKAGFIGLGHLGKAMAKRVLQRDLRDDLRNKSRFTGLLGHIIYGILKEL